MVFKTFWRAAVISVIKSEFTWVFVFQLGSERLAVLRLIGWDPSPPRRFFPRIFQRNGVWSAGTIGTVLFGKYQQIYISAFFGWIQSGTEQVNLICNQVQRIFKGRCLLSIQSHSISLCKLTELSIFPLYTHPLTVFTLCWVGSQVYHISTVGIRHPPKSVAAFWT